MRISDLTAWGCAGAFVVPTCAIMKERFRVLAAALVAIWLVAVPACAADAKPQKHPDILAAKVRPSGSDAFDFDVTVSSPYDTAQRYADAFRVTSREGVVYGERTLFHDHADEQPFIRDLHGVKVPRGVRHVVIQGRDKRYGYGGKTLEVNLPGR